MVETHITKVFISAAETSGDKHAAHLINALKVQIPRVKTDGLGGSAMEKAGCNLLENLIERSAMLGAAVKQIPFYHKLLKRVKAYLLEETPDLVILVDSPAWNFHIAKAARQLGIPVLYYIAPQLWAWGAWRLKKLRNNVDKVACILPFEEEWFRSRGVPAEYVGHPLFDDSHLSITYPGESGNNNTAPTVALLPGSRSQEIEKLWKPMLTIALNIRRKYPNTVFLTTASNEKNEQQMRQALPDDFDIEFRDRGIEAVTRYADLTLVASGTATLEVAAQACPMIVMYHINPVSWNLVGRLLIKTKHLSLVNILAGVELVPEYMPFFHQEQEVSEVALEILGSEERKKRFAKVTAKSNEANSKTRSGGTSGGYRQTNDSERLSRAIEYFFRDFHPKKAI